MKAELRARFGNTVTSNDLWNYNREYFNRATKGELTKIRRGVWNLTGDDENVTILPINEVVNADMIRERFEVLGLLANGVVEGNIRSLIISGAPGVGKTHELERKLKNAERSNQIISYVSIKGSISPIGLYEALYNNCEKGQVVVLDDLDSVFDNEETLNILKAALDTGTKRIISWAKASRFLADSDIPRSFEYCGQIVFITNTDPDRVIAKGGRLAPHMNALVSRSVFLDLCIHDNESIMVRVEQVLRESELADDLDIDEDAVEAIIEWMHQNVKRLRSLSIRTVIQLASYIKTSEDWKKLAAATMLRPN